MTKLKAWWVTLAWWQKGLAVIPVGLVALALLVRAYWPRTKAPLPVLPPTEIAPSVGAREVECVIDVALGELQEQQQAAEEAATDAKAKIDRASTFSDVDDVLYGTRK